MSVGMDESYIDILVRRAGLHHNMGQRLTTSRKAWSSADIVIVRSI